VAFLVGQGTASDPASGLPDPGAWKFRVAPVDPRVDDRDADRVNDGKLGRERVEGVILRQVVLLRREGIVRDEAGTKGNRNSGRRQRKRQDRNCSCLHEVETWSTGEKPTT
jgi:hypothetical protein